MFGASVIEFTRNQRSVSIGYAYGKLWGILPSLESFSLDAYDMQFKTLPESTQSGIIQGILAKHKTRCAISRRLAGCWCICSSDAANSIILESLELSW
jgi:hypothetical protein